MPNNQDPAPHPPVIGGLVRGAAWVAPRVPLQVLFAFWSVPLIQGAIGLERNGAYVFATSFGFLQPLVGLGMGPALQRHLALAWVRADRDAVDGAVACGVAYFLVAAGVQVALIAGLIHLLLPHTAFDAEQRGLIAHLLWLQAAAAPALGLAVVVAAVLRAAGRFGIVPKCELAIAVGRFGIVLLGVRLGLGILMIVGAQLLLEAALLLGPPLAAARRLLGRAPRLARANLRDLAALSRVGSSVFLMQLGTILADRLDAVVLGLSLGHEAGTALSIYQVVSRPAIQLRQAGSVLAVLVMPVTAVLDAAADRVTLDALRYDCTRWLIALIAPVAVLAAVEAPAFLAAWLHPAMGQHAGLLRLHLLSALPLVVAVPVQMAIGIGRVGPIARVVVAGSVVNLALSWVLARHLGVAGVIWGTVLTTIPANFLFPALCWIRVFRPDLRTVLRRTLAPPALGVGAALLVVALVHALGWGDVPAAVRRSAQIVRLLVDVGVGIAAYLLGYAVAPAGRADLTTLIRLPGKLLRPRTGDQMTNRSSEKR